MGKIRFHTTSLKLTLTVTLTVCLLVATDLIDMQIQFQI